MFDIKNYGINITPVLFNKSSVPTADINHFECFGFKDVSEIHDISGCLKMMNANCNCGGLVLLFKAKKNMELLNKKVYLSGINACIFKPNGNIHIIKKFYKNDLVEVLDDSAIQRVEDDEDLMQFGFVFFFDKPEDLNNISNMNIDIFFAIDSVKKSYLVSKRGIEVVDGKLVCKNMEIKNENRNVYVYQP